MSFNSDSDLIINISDDDSVVTEAISDAYIITPEGVIEIVDNDEDREFLLVEPDSDLVGLVDDDIPTDGVSEGDQNVDDADMAQNHEDWDNDSVSNMSIWDDRASEFGFSTWGDGSSENSDGDVDLWDEQIFLPPKDSLGLDASYNSAVEVYLTEREFIVEE